MKNIGLVTDDKDIVTKEYCDKVYVNATDTIDGEAGRVPQPLAGSYGKFLSATGGWDYPPGFEPSDYSQLLKDQLTSL